MSKSLLLSYREEQKLSKDELIIYYNNLKCSAELFSSVQDRSMSIGQKLINSLYMNDFYNRKLEIQGEENISLEQPCIYLCNHSNAHDVFSMYKLLAKLNLPASVMVADDCLSVISKSIFASADSTFLDRRDKESSSKSIIDASAKILSGKNLVVFGETTWNIHPIKRMHNLKRGAAMISTITGAPVIPTILEYVENEEICYKEKDLYKKIILRFEKPVSLFDVDKISENSDFLYNTMIDMRVNIWNDHNINKDKITDINPYIYVNHTLLKKFGVMGFDFNSSVESSYLFKDKENEYTMNDNGVLVPGVSGKKLLKKI